MTVIPFKPHEPCTTRILREPIAKAGLSPRCEFRLENLSAHVEALVRHETSIPIFEAIAAQGINPRWDTVRGSDNEDFVIIETEIDCADVARTIKGFAASGVVEARVYNA